MEIAQVSDPSKCLFVDDNRRNIDAAIALGWVRSVHFCEKGLEHVEGGKVKSIGEATDVDNDTVQTISHLEELRQIWPDIFKS